MREEFWSSGILTGNQTQVHRSDRDGGFWSSGILTGNQTIVEDITVEYSFWSSGILTGNQTSTAASGRMSGFGAVAF